MVPATLVSVWLGGTWLLLVIALVLSAAVIEFCRLMQRDGFAVSSIWALALLGVLLVDAQFPGRNVLQPGVVFVLMGSVLCKMRRHGASPVAEWALGVVGPLYIGGLGVYIIHLRSLPDGLWWLLVVFPAIWLADSAAYSVGRAWGRHKLAPVLSPNKTWEGYIGGVVAGTLAAAGLAALWGLREGVSHPTPLEGMAAGFLVAVFAPLGDLVVSMIKRHVGVKDSGTIFPGHGGAFDRIDSLLWAAVIGYYFALWFAGF
ncbi:MAG: CDP-archaeol synthase [Anaerolineae bacterium]|nr:CDP-archaeol synthase [Anaerolineae bacterium]